MHRLCAILAGALTVGCSGGDPLGPVERGEQGLTIYRNPFGEGEPVAAAFGKLGQNGHYIIFQRRRTGQCWFTPVSSGPLREDVEIHLSNGDDRGVVVLQRSAFACEGSIYELTKPELAYVDNSGATRHWSATIYGFFGNDFLSCNHKGTCYGGDGNDTLATWASVSAAEPVILNGEEGDDKVIVYEPVPVAMQGGAGQDCLHHPNPGLTLSYECTDSDTDDPEWDRSAGFIGTWCNDIETQQCATWPW